jgi:S-DNA-T family DNA segregation ATPase FtsK/SpoIIIE
VSVINHVDAGHRLGLLCDAVEVVAKAQYAHQDLIQRRVRVGFATAGALLDLMEGAGVIGPLVHGQKRREVLVSQEQVPAVLAELRGERADA